MSVTVQVITSKLRIQTAKTSIFNKYWSICKLLGGYQAEAFVVHSNLFPFSTKHLPKRGQVSCAAGFAAEQLEAFSSFVLFVRFCSAGMWKKTCLISINGWENDCTHLFCFAQGLGHIPVNPMWKLHRGTWKWWMVFGAFLQDLFFLGRMLTLLCVCVGWFLHAGRQWLNIIYCSFIL